MHNPTRRSWVFLFVFICLVFTSLTQQEAQARRRRKAPSESIAADLAAGQSAEANVQVDHVDGSTLYFKTLDNSPAPKPLNLEPFTDIQVIGTLRGAPGGQPYQLIHAKPCKDCKLEPGIYAVQAVGGKPVRYSEPGRILDYRTHAVVFDARTFYGHCVAGRKGDVLVVFQREKVDRRKSLQLSVMVAEPTIDEVVGGKPLDHLHEQLIERRGPSLNTTLKLVHSKLCREISGRNRVMASHPPEVSLKRPKAEEEDDDDKTDDKDGDDDAVAPDAAPAPAGST